MRMLSKKKKLCYLKKKLNFSAHCTFEFNHNITLRAGSTFRDRGGVVVNVSRIYQHPNFNIDTYDYDYSILEFSNLLKFSDQIQPVKLPSSGYLPVNTECIVSGFGVTEQGAIVTELRSAKVNTVDGRQCQESYKNVNFDITPRMICAKGLYSDACYADSVIIGDKLFKILTR